MGKAAPDPLVGRTIAGKFVVEDLIGSGAMGAVYRARQIALEKTIAIKVLHGEHAGDPAFAARFHREAKAASRLNHPNSIQVIDFGEEPDGLLYIAMEYLDGRSLHRLLREEPLPSRERVVDILMQALAAIAVAHDMGVVHRDLKPENIVVLRGTDDDGHPKDIVKVLDFGIAKITDSRAYRSGPEHDSAAPVTSAGFLVGTPEYMSPEQGKGEKLDPRSDLYSVGVVLYEMLSGRVPFEAENAIGVILRHITEAPPPPSQIVPAVDAGLEAICMRAMRKAREERYQTAREMRAELRAALEGRGSAQSGPVLFGEARTLLAMPASGTSGASHAHPGVAISSDDIALKPTLTGTAASVPGAPRRRAAMVATVLGVSVAAAAVTFALLGRSHRSQATVTSVTSGATSVPMADLGPDPGLPPLAEASSRGPAHAGAGHPGHAPSAKAGASPSIPAASSPPAIASSASAASAASAMPLASAASVTPPVPAPASASASEPVAAADPSFDPEKGFVEMGIIVAQGIPQHAVRETLRTAGFTGCYRRALRTQGASATGTGKLDLSIDENGTTRSAIVSGASFLPGLTRCLQGAAAGVSFPRATMESGGGTAEVTLSFRSP